MANRFRAELMLDSYMLVLEYSISKRVIYICFAAENMMLGPHCNKASMHDCSIPLQPKAKRHLVSKLLYRTRQLMFHSVVQSISFVD